GHERAVDATDPGDDRAVVESDRQVHLHRDFTAKSFDDPDHVDRLVADGHEVGDTDGAFGHVELGLEHERAVSIAAAGGAATGGGGDEPVAMAVVPEERGELSGAVEARRA